MIRSPELTSTTEITINYEQDRAFSLTRAIRRVRQQGIYVHQFSDEQVDRISSIDILDAPRKREIRGGWDIDRSEKFEEAKKADLWRLLTGDTRYKMVTSIANFYRPNDTIPQHFDYPAHSMKKLPLDSLATMMTFNYVLSGEKDILCYMEGKVMPPTTLRQKPGMLMVFPMTNILDADNQLMIPVLWHEVQPQDAVCDTLNWELMVRG